MEKRFRLFWLRESGCDAGTPLTGDELDGSIREQVLALAGVDQRPIEIRLPFFDHREWVRRSETVRGLTLIREGDTIHAAVQSSSTRIKDRAAELVALHPAWRDSPRETQSHYFTTWRGVSIALQKSLRVWMPENYFLQLERFEDRECAYPFLVYAATRPCPGRPRTEFTWDIADEETLPEAMRLRGQALRDVLTKVEKRLHAAGRHELSRRYAPVWFEDIVRAVHNRPQPLVELLGTESTVVNALVHLGASHSLSAVKPFAKSASYALRSVCGEDFRSLALRLLQTGTEELERRKETKQKPNRKRTAASASCTAAIPVSQSPRSHPLTAFTENTFTDFAWQRCLGNLPEERDGYNPLQPVETAVLSDDCDG